MRVRLTAMALMVLAAAIMPARSQTPPSGLSAEEAMREWQGRSGGPVPTAPQPPSSPVPDAPLDAARLLDPLLTMGCTMNGVLRDYAFNLMESIDHPITAKDDLFKNDIARYSTRTVHAGSDQDWYGVSFLANVTWRNLRIKVIVYEQIRQSGNWRVLIVFDEREAQVLTSIGGSVRNAQMSLRDPVSDRQIAVIDFAGRGALDCQSSSGPWISALPTRNGDRLPRHNVYLDNPYSSVTRPTPPPVTGPTGNDGLDAQERPRPPLTRERVQLRPSSPAVRNEVAAVSDLEVCNKTSQVMSVMLAYPREGGASEWIAHGWGTIAGLTCDTFKVPTGTVHYYAQTKTKVWAGKAAYYCATSKPFERRVFANGKCVGGERRLGAVEVNVNGTLTLNLLP